MAEQVEAQKKLAETENPVIVTSKVSEKVKSIEENLMKLLSKKKPKKVQVKKEPETTEKTEEESSKEDTQQEAPPVHTETPTSEEHEHDEL